MRLESSISLTNFKPTRISCLFWWPATYADFLNYDDPVFVGQASMIHQGLSLDTLRGSFSHVGSLNLWHPLTWISFQLEASFFGSSANVHHTTNVLLHALNAGLITLLARAFRLPAFACLSLGILFAIHPSAAQSVMWISERKGLLATFFTLSSLLSWDQALQGNKRFSLLTTLLAAAALLSKPSAVILPGLLILQALYTQKGKQLSLKQALSSAPRTPLIATSLLSIVAATITLNSQKQGGLANLSNAPLIDRVSTIPEQAQFYIESFIGTSDYRGHGFVAASNISLPTQQCLLSRDRLHPDSLFMN